MKMESRVILMRMLANVPNQDEDRTFGVQLNVNPFTHRQFRYTLLEAYLDIVSGTLEEYSHRIKITTKSLMTFA